MAMAPKPKDSTHHMFKVDSGCPNPGLVFVREEPSLNSTKLGYKWNGETVRVCSGCCPSFSDCGETGVMSAYSEIIRCGTDVSSETMQENDIAQASSRYQEQTESRSSSSDAYRMGGARNNCCHTTPKGWVKLADEDGWMLWDGNLAGIPKIMLIPLRDHVCDIQHERASEVCIASGMPENQTDSQSEIMRRVFELHFPKSRKSAKSTCDDSAAAVERGLGLVRTSQDKMGLAAHLRRCDGGIKADDGNCVLKMYIDEVDSKLFTPKLFFEKYVRKNKPVLMKGALQDWFPLHAWDDTYLMEKVGEVSIKVRVSPHRCLEGVLFGHPDRVHNYDVEEVTMREFIASLSADQPPYYAARLQVSHTLSSIFPDVENPPGDWCAAFDSPLKDQPLCYFGAGDQATPLHFDPAENLFCMVDGQKSIELFHPGLSHLLYPCGDRNSSSVYSLVNPLDPDKEKFPLYSTALAWHTIVHKGDLLYLPMGWWHVVRGGHGRNLSLNYWFKAHPDKYDPSGILQGLLNPTS